ncbi:MAG: insulinase family protein [Flammeovirgaceae bacterium]|nr:insulinase family protein [Flammeovirgaceae bacterium]
MIHYEEFTLSNGLQVLVHPDPTVQVAVLNILYRVGSRDERPDKTGFAHLFEHLMFGGSANIPNYDEPLQAVGGDNNAFTSPDITNYYLTVPYENIETGFWLESDRMLSLSFDPGVLDVQRKVVIEEFNQRYLNQPYGDTWLKLRPLVYQKHPYQWATIGKDPEHIRSASMEDVKDFFFRFYRPDNATLVVAGNVTTKQIKRLAEKWFGPIPPGRIERSKLVLEDYNTGKKFIEVKANVPADAFYMTYLMPGRFESSYYATDLLSDVLGRGDSSRLYNKLVKEKEIFTSISSYVTGSLDPGLLVISGRLRETVSMEQGHDEVVKIIAGLVADGPTEKEIEKVKNLSLSSIEFDELDVLNRGMNLAFASLSGNPDLVNSEREIISKITRNQLAEEARKILVAENSGVMYYRRFIEEV